MTRCSIWRCKQCGAVINNAEDAKIFDSTFDELFSLETVCNNLKGFDLPTVKFTHRCDPQTIGLCEFIGWRKYE